MRAEPPGLNRRALLAAPLALTACDRFASAQSPVGPLAPPLKSLAAFPIGATGMTGQLDDPVWVAAVRRHLDQITPEWELKPERILQPGFRYDFSASDRMVDWGHEQDLRVFGHCLVWYSQGLDQFTEALPAARFAAEFDRYISTVAGRYRGRMVGWDVVNEAVAEDGGGLRDCIYARKLGPEAYILRAFQQARAADPDAVLFLNDYNLENNPRKGATFLRLVERLLAQGAPIGGIGTQSHLDIDIPAGQIRDFFRDAASLGLPIHVSELDFSMRSDSPVDTRSLSQKRARQVARVGELAEAFMALPARQRFAFTTWGLRDVDSWLLRPEGRGWKDDSPLLLDAEGRPNPAFQAVAEAFGG